MFELLSIKYILLDTMTGLFVMPEIFKLLLDKILLVMGETVITSPCSDIR